MKFSNRDRKVGKVVKELSSGEKSEPPLDLEFSRVRLDDLLFPGVSYLRPVCPVVVVPG